MRSLAPSVLFVAFAFWPALAQASDFDQLDFLTGHWRGDISGAVVEEWWSPSDGSTKIAAFRWATDEKTGVIELVIISEEEEGAFLRFKHFTPDFSSWEKDEPNTYRLVAATGARAEFRLTSVTEEVPEVLIYSLKDGVLRFRDTDHPEIASHPDDLVLTFTRAE